MSSLLKMGTDLAEQSKAQQQRTGEMLKAAFSEHESFVKSELNESAKRIRYAISAHEKGMTEAMESNRLNVRKMVGRTWLTIMMVSVLLLAMNGSILWWQGQKMLSNYRTLSGQKESMAKLNAKTWGVRYQETSDGRRFLIVPKGTQPEIIPYNGTKWIQLRQE
ncbi:TPA: MbeB family mobilization protein [Klebsiella michiganensis]|nr:MbeB family mobilization protein [Klebsiella michiganensis]